MNKKDILILAKKSNNERGLRGFLVHRPSDCTPYIVCSHLTIDDNDQVDWDWGHYCNNIFTALYVFYEYEIQDLNIFDKEELDWLDWYTTERSSKSVYEIEVNERQQQILETITTLINGWLDRDSASIRL